ncbi:serine protease [Micromonospora echinospora]|uniref:Peptidase inhibitor I9 n=1 Tax=Micromonospora echinospora TaxID=1877 RepID=A0A1C4ZAE7_MICEC|nr:S8 family peptidase [Micromonospora echinospora]OZV80523.1 serine protease [Micromonospora echinospora]SCF29972.1 Peptidase inhibitor I9 [Micromonospora echinospora]
MTSLISRRRRSGVVGVLAVSAMVAATVGGPASAAPAVGEILRDGGATAVPGSYLVVLRDSAVGGPAGTRLAAVAQQADHLADRYGGTVGHRYGHALNGFEVRLPEPAARRLAADPAVAFVEQNHTVRTATTQVNAPWNLDRIDQRTTPLPGYSYTSTGRGVTAYIIDSGIRLTHVEFGWRAGQGYDAVDGALPADDCNGHGTQVAGIVGGRTYGVAKEVRLVPVRVIDCAGSGTLAGLIAGINWVTADHDPGEPASANISLGVGMSTSLNAAVVNSIADGVTYSIAAGNSNTDACNFSPQSVREALVVGATQSNDTRGSFSNWGSCVDIYAPGVSILSPSYGSDTATVVVSGTSFAAPHVTGSAARVLQNNPAWTPAQVAAYLVAQATPVNNLRLLYMDPLT